MATLQQVVADIKSLKIQGAQATSEAALRAWDAAKDKKLASKLLKASRPTEPMLFNAISAAEKGADPKKLIVKFHADKEKIYKFGASLIKNNSVIFTHCHSSTVTGILKEAKKQGKKFTVNNTETRPMYQGRLTASELAKAGIKVNHYVDSAAIKAMQKADLFLIGADWISPKGVANKIGTELFAEIACKYYKIPIYCCSHSWKFSRDNITIEQRPANEVWQNAPRGVLVYNPAFEIAEAQHIKSVISELGVLGFKDFVKKETVRHERL
jgi:ribose 1,5-bisphosphate isomerase